MQQLESDSGVIATCTGLLSIMNSDGPEIERLSHSSHLLLSECQIRYRWVFPGHYSYYQYLIGTDTTSDRILVVGMAWERGWAPL